MKSLKSVDRIQRLTKEMGITYRNLYLVANYRFNDELEKRIQSNGGTYLGRIDYDARVEQYNLDGTSLLELPQDSPASLSVRRILEKAGYQLR